MPKKNNKTVMPDPLPNGEVLSDIAKKKWCLGPSIGVGGFGEIYSAAEYNDGSKKSLNYQYVVKIEPHGNGPLFCEMHFFMRNAKPDMIQNWCAENKMKTLGMPRYLGSGSHEHNGKKYRFLVMDRYGKDLWHFFLENKKQFPAPTVYRIGIQILEALEYIHNKGYVHADIKGANILMGLSKSVQNQVYLVDFGLASHYTKKDYKPEPKKSHNGTIEYTSRDAHEGVPTRRGDIEILAYNLVHWMGCTLPWEKCLSNPVAVHESKKKSMDNVNAFLTGCFGKNKVPAALRDFLEYVHKMKYDTEPDYTKLRSILSSGIKAAGGSLTASLVFKSIPAKHKQQDDDDSVTPEKRRKLSPTKGKKQKVTDNENTPDVSTKSKRRVKKTEPVNDISDSESESDEDKPVAKKKTQNRVKKTEPVNESESEEEKPVPKKKTQNRVKKTEPVNESESEEEKPVPKKKTQNRAKKTKEKAAVENGNGYNAEMLRMQKKIQDRKAGNTKKKSKANDPSSSNGTDQNALNVSLGLDGDDIVDATPPENLKVRKNRRVNNTPTLNGDSDREVTPRSLRQRK